MSGHKRVKNLDLDEDEYDEYDEEEYGEEGHVQGDDVVDDGMTPEDREQMQIGTAKVRSTLGESFEVSDQQIQEALWYYYFDTDKTVVYLKSTLPSVVNVTCSI